MNQKLSPVRATYRLQLTPDFTFNDVQNIVSYLADLGISHVYLSPIFQAQAGSTHGYDVVDHNQINQELGGSEAFLEMVNLLQSRDLGVVIDFVPNHMGINGSLNWRWLEVLEEGKSSRFASYFDIEWKPRSGHLRDRVLIPVLHDLYGKVLQEGEIRLRVVDGRILADYRGNQFPLCPSSQLSILQALSTRCPEGARVRVDDLVQQFTDWEANPVGVVYPREKVADLRAGLSSLLAEDSLRACLEQILRELNGIPGQPNSFDLLHELLEQQHYVLSYWKTGPFEINYRRFFTVDSLIGIKMEDPEVFASTHALVRQFAQQGIIQGIRIDHIDGLWDPKGYLRNLESTFKGAPAALYTLVEKILTDGETLPRWAVNGTTGYEFAGDLVNLLTATESEQAFTELYRDFTGISGQRRQFHRATKLEIIDRLFPTVIDGLTDGLERLAKADRNWRDLTRAGLKKTLGEVIASLQVYRTYRRGDDPLTEEDRRVIESAVRQARQENYSLDGGCLKLLEDLWLGAYPDREASSEKRREAHAWVNKFQQITGAIMAKSVEDTLFYRYVRLFAHSEVGHDPFQFGKEPGAFHEANLARRRQWPSTMLSTSTHDTKTSEDVRARLLALSDQPTEWKTAILTWREMNREHKTMVGGREAPEPNEEYLLYQALIGAWPLDESLPSEQFIGRIKAYFVKAVCEAKLNSGWITPNEAWQQACESFVVRILSPRSSPFLEQLRDFVKVVAQRGMDRSLVQTTLKLTSPGIPDLYQGNEIWDFSLVDPDNRRPIDYSQRMRALQSMAEAPSTVGDLMESWTDGRIKLFVTSRLLGFRTQQPDLFLEGDYIPLELTGAWKDRALAFKRTARNRSLLVLVAIRQLPDRPLHGAFARPEQVPERYSDLFSEREINFSSEELALQDVLAGMPVAVWSTLKWGKL